MEATYATFLETLKTIPNNCSLCDQPFSKRNRKSNASFTFLNNCLQDKVLLIPADLPDTEDSVNSIFICTSCKNGDLYLQLTQYYTALKQAIKDFCKVRLVLLQKVCQVRNVPNEEEIVEYFKQSLGPSWFDVEESLEVKVEANYTDNEESSEAEWNDLELTGYDDFNRDSEQADTKLLDDDEWFIKPDLVYNDEEQTASPIETQAEHCDELHQHKRKRKLLTTESARNTVINLRTKRNKLGSPCEHCKKPYRRSSDLRNHIKNVHGISENCSSAALDGKCIRSCYFCLRKFPRSNELQVHLRKHTGEKPFLCDYCGEGAISSSKVEIHIEKEHPEFAPFPCEICGSRFFRESRLREHLKEHYGKSITGRIDSAGKQPHTSCYFCQRQFKRNNEYHDHVHTHTGEKPHRCDHCCESAITTMKLEQHIEKAHPSIPPKKCQFCGCGFFRDHRLRDHERTHGKLPDPNPSVSNEFICDYCGKIYTNYRSFRHHITKHINPNPVLCDECGKGFTTKRNLDIHIRMVHQKAFRFNCEVCGNLFIHESHLRLHMRKHTGEKPFQCETCGKCFSLKIRYTNHLRTHTNEKPFGCEICGRTYPSSKSLGRHRRMHRSQDLLT